MGKQIAIAGTERPTVPEVAAAVIAAKTECELIRQAPQQFFASLASAARNPGTGEHYREFVKHLLLRAQEAQLYTPETP